MLAPLGVAVEPAVAQGVQQVGCTDADEQVGCQIALVLLQPFKVLCGQPFGEHAEHGRYQQGAAYVSHAAQRGPQQRFPRP